jgi:outer membrane receptor protein involved in Fe transport
MNLISRRSILLASAAVALTSLSPDITYAQSSAEVQEVVVTANRREELLSKVPLPVTAMTQDQLTQQRITKIDDLARVTPGVSFQRGGYGSSRAPLPSIRGVGSGIGTGTTAVYVNDTPVNVRFASNISTTLFPRLFDLERVEVLRGPQGTLFGASAMGGAIRFITPEPSLTTPRLRAASEVSTTGGDIGYEVGAAIGGPIVQDRVGFNASLFYRRDPGYVDRRNIFTNEVTEDNNWGEAIVFHGALKFQATEHISITPGFLAQYEYVNDGTQYWTNLSDRGDNSFVHGGQLKQSSLDRFYLPSLKINYDLGFAEIVANTSYLYRQAHANPDYTQEINAILINSFDSGPALFADEAIPAYYRNKQTVFTQEVRIQSTDSAARLRWVAGAFYSKLEQRDLQISAGGASLEKLTQTLFGASVADIFGIPNGSGYGFDDITYLVTDRPRETMQGLFGQIDFEVIDRLTLTAGLRYSRDRSSFSSFTGGPFNGAEQAAEGRFKESEWTPKFGVSYEINDDNMVYANAAKGFRPGGAFPPVPFNFCREDLQNLGLTGSPATYGSDTLWNYEVGSKNALLDRRLRVDASAYYIKWKDIQRQVPLPICTLNYVTNLGTAISKGFELSLTARPIDALTLVANIGYVNAESGETLLSAPRANGVRQILTKKGAKISGIRPWTFHVGGTYDFDAFERPAYVRIDLEHLSREADELDPTVQGFNALTSMRAKAYTVVKARAGISFDRIEVSAFADNLFDQHPILTRGNYSTRSGLIYENTLPPRTIGLRLDYRY